MMLPVLITKVYGQNDADKTRLIQFSGLILTEADDQPIPYASVRIKNTYRGTIASMEGFFSIAMQKTDTIIFSAVGFKKKMIVLPKDMENNSFSTIIELKADTLTYSEMLIYPWPTPDKFKDAFLALEVNKDYYDKARDNLSWETMMRYKLNLNMDGRENQRIYMNQMVVNAGYLGGQTNYAQFPGMGFPIPLSLLDPQAWAKFIKAIRTGGFKDKYKEFRE